MSKNNIYHYFVEGECEEKLINTFKVPPYLYFQSGKIEVYNFINKRITNQRLMALNVHTVIILVYDIDVEKTEILDDNIRFLKKAGFVVHHIQSIKNFENELVYSSKLKSINMMYGTDNIDAFKNCFINQHKLDRKLNSIDFNKDKIWSRINKNKPFNKYSNQASLYLIRKK